VGFTVSCDGTIYRAFLWGKGSMIDLNTLIPPRSSLQLVLAMDINDRGEIDGEGVPLGVPPANWVTEGHEFLLIPCDEKHPGIEGCDYSLVEPPAAMTQPVPATREAFSRALPPLLLRRMSRYHFPGRAFGPRNQP